MISKKIIILGSNGYVGSRLSERWKATHQLSLVDTCWFGEPKENTFVEQMNPSNLAVHLHKVFSKLSMVRS